MKSKSNEVLNIENLNKGNFMQIASVFSKVGQVMLDKQNTDFAKITTIDNDDKPTLLAIATNDEKKIKALLDFIETLN